MEDLREISIPFEEYKELLIIKGKYEELSKIQQPLIVYDGYKENGTNNPLPKTPYKVTF